MDNNPGWRSCNCGVRRRIVEIINLESYITASGKYKDRLHSDELTKEVKDNAVLLLNKVNQLLKELNITSVQVSSGFRPSDVNAATKGSAKRSLHMTGCAVDILDVDHKIAHAILANPDLLHKYGLWMESPDHTPNWLHLDIGNRKERELRIFNP